MKNQIIKILFCCFVINIFAADPTPDAVRYNPAKTAVLQKFFADYKQASIPMQRRVIERLLNERADPNVEVDGTTIAKKIAPLALAVNCNDQPLIALLLNKHADSNQVDSDGRVSLYYAKTVPQAEFLIKHGIGVTPRQAADMMRRLVDSLGGFEDSSLRSLIEYYCKAGIDPMVYVADQRRNAREYDVGKTMALKRLFDKRCTSSKQIIQYQEVAKFLKEGADPQIASCGRYLLSWTTRDDNVLFTQLLLEYRADPNVENPLKEAKSDKMAELLLQHKARVDGDTFLAAPSMDRAELFLKYGAIVDEGSVCKGLSQGGSHSGRALYCNLNMNLKKSWGLRNIFYDMLDRQYEARRHGYSASPYDEHLIHAKIVLLSGGVDCSSAQIEHFVSNYLKKDYGEARFPRVIDFMKKLDFIQMARRIQLQDALEATKLLDSSENRSERNLYEIVADYAGAPGVSVKNPTQEIQDIEREVLHF